MNKKYAIGGVAFIAVIFVIIFLMNGKDNRQTLSEKNNDAISSQKTVSDDVVNGSEPEVQDSFVSKVKKMMEGGKAVSCKYSIDSDGSSVKTTVYMEGERKYKMMMDMGKTGKQYVLSDGKMMWSWNDTQKQGYSLDLSCMEEINKQSKRPEEASMMEEYQYDSNEEIIAQDPDMECEEGGSVDFSLPKDIVFTDQCAILKQSAAMMEQFKGMNIPQAPAAK